MDGLCFRLNMTSVQLDNREGEPHLTMPAEPLPAPADNLQVRGLTIHHITADGTRIPAVEDVSFSIARGETVGLLGESGCGKSTVALALLGLLPETARVVKGTVHWHGRELLAPPSARLALPEQEWQPIRGAQIALIPQEPGLALNPVLRAGRQIAEVLRAHGDASESTSYREQVETLLAQVGFDETARIASAYPHQLSGGQQQRVVIAQALAGRPALLVADEPAASLDTTLQRDILALLKQLQQRLGMAVLFISHNPALLARLAGRLLVMYAGRIVEEGSTDQVLRNPLHPYTRGLLQSLPPPARESDGDRKPLPVITGSPPDPAHLPAGCRFEPRCPDRKPECAQREPNEVQPEAARRVRCFLYGG